MASVKAFRESFMGSDLAVDGDFSDFDARKLRYMILWAMYENTAYRDFHTWAHGYKSSYGLYRHIRNIYNPSYRIGEFYKAHLLGGAIDPAAGDGKTAPSAMPIITVNDNPRLREAISRVWLWSNWQITKDVLALRTTVLGDGAIKVIDDPRREKVYLKLVYPGTIKELGLDEWGNVKGYEIEEERRDPRDKSGKKKVKYRETASRDGDLVVYRTFLNDSPYAWDGDGQAEWVEPYGFTPMVVFQHNNVGLDFGWSELHPGLSQFREVDDLASKLSDQIRKMVDSPWLFSGVEDPAKRRRTPETTASVSTANAPEPGREDIPALYGPVGASATPLVAPLDIGSTSAYIKEILADIERNYPELDEDMNNIQGDISGRAIRLNRAPAENKVLQRRPNYDNAIVRAQQMAVAIGGLRGYDGFDGFSLDSYAAGDLDHTIGTRPVFSKDPMDELERDEKFYQVANSAKAFGIPPLVFLERKGWSQEEIKKVEGSPEFKARLAAMQAASQAAEIPPRREPKE